MTIHRPELAEADVRSLVRETEEFLRSRDAEVTGTDLWGKRRFAYEIDHLKEGYYSVISFQAEPTVVDDLDRLLGLADRVVRHKVVRVGEVEAQDLSQPPGTV
ncbi:MAG: 30S ribosomal protein S6 [Actinomycetota bacterium]|nr:30S ribosomal protein S6 [Actinomycetota bacterium]